MRKYLKETIYNNRETKDKMPPYNPPCTTSYYSHIHAFPKIKSNLKLIGKSGNNFIRLTNKLNIEYIWWNKELNIIEIWGPKDKIAYSKNYMTKYLERFFARHCKDD